MSELRIVKDFFSDVNDIDRRDFKLISNTGQEFDLLTQAGIIIPNKTEHFLYEVNGFGYEYETESIALGSNLVMSSYSLKPRKITGTIMFDSYTSFYKYVDFLNEYQDMEANVFETENMLNLQYKTIERNGIQIKNMIKIVAKKAEVSEKDKDGLLYVPIEYEAYTLTNNLQYEVNSGILNFTKCNIGDRTFPLPSIVEGTSAGYIGFSGTICDRYDINIKNETNQTIKTKFRFFDNVINPTWFFRDDRFQIGGIEFEGSEGDEIILNGLTQKAYNKEGESLDEYLNQGQNNFIELRSGDNPLSFVLQDKNPNGLQCSIIIEILVQY